MKVIGYTRVSTEEQATSGISLADQAAKIRAYATLYDLDLVELVEDAGESAKSMDRPAMQAALLAVREGRAQGILVAKLDRLTRSVGDMANLITEYFGDRSTHGASLFSVTDLVDTRSANGRLSLNIITTVAQWEREVIGERTRAALAHLKANGVKLGQPVLEADAEGQATAARIHELKAEGKTLRDIAAVLTAEGRKTRRGGAWAPATIAKVLARKEAA